MSGKNYKKLVIYNLNVKFTFVNLKMFACMCQVEYNYYRENIYRTFVEQRIKSSYIRKKWNENFTSFDIFCRISLFEKVMCYNFGGDNNANRFLFK